MLLEQDTILEPLTEKMWSFLYNRVLATAKTLTAENQQKQVRMPMKFLFEFTRDFFDIRCMKKKVAVFDDKNVGRGDR